MNISPQSGIPLTWRELLLNERRLIHERLLSIQQLVLTIPIGQPTSTLSAILTGAAETMAAALILLGPAHCKSCIDRFLPLLTSAVRNINPTELEQARVIYGLASFINLAECLDVEVDIEIKQSVQQLLQALISSKALIPELLYSSIIMVGIVFHYEDLTLELLNKNQQDTFISGKTFQFNVSDLLHYLIMAIRQSQSLDTILPAWSDFLTAFPYQLAAQILSWTDLLCVARIVFVRVDQNVPGRVGNILHGSILSLTNDDRI